jgi:SulP family sulfate permease
MADEGALRRIRSRAAPARARARRRLHPRRLFPGFQSLPGYSRKIFTGDLAAGLTVGAVLIPQGMAYALLAGLPPEAGLYAAVLPLVAYALLGGSRQLGIGPTAISSLLVAAGVAPLARGDVDVYVGLAASLAIVVGLMRIAMGLGRLGFVVNFLSRPVLSGFTSAAALIIAVSQLKHLLGIPLRQSEHIHVVLSDAIRHLGDVHFSTLAIGTVGFLLLWALRRWRPAWPWALFVVMAATAVVAALGLDGRGVKVVGEIPRGLPSFSVPRTELGQIEALLPTAIAITMLGFVESIAIAKVFAHRHGYKIRPNQELVAIGVATVAAGVSHGYPVSGSFSRTAVNASTGARTQLAGVISAAVVALTLVVLTPLFRPLPNAVLASVVFMAVAGLVDVAEARRLYRVKRSDFHLLVLCFVSTLFLGIQLGILISVVASLLVVLRQTTRPHTAILGRIPGTAAFRNVERSPEAVTTEGVVVLRVDAPLYFANAEFLKEELRRVEARQHGRMRVLVLDASSVNDIDSSADQALQEIADDYAARGLDLYLANVKGLILDVMRRSGFYERLGPDRFFLSTEEAVRQAEATLHGGDEIRLDLPQAMIVVEKPR